MNVKDLNFKHVGKAGIAVVRVTAVLGVLALLIIPVVVMSIAMLVGVIFGRRQLYALELVDMVFDIFHKLLVWTPDSAEVGGHRLDGDIEKLLG